MLLLATTAFALDLALRVEQPDLPPTRVVLCGLAEDGMSSETLEVRTRTLRAIRFHVFARPVADGVLQVDVPWAVADLRHAPLGPDESEVHKIVPAVQPAFLLKVGETRAQAYPVDLEGRPYPAHSPRFTLTVTRLAPGAPGCAG
ncbi:MAG: hypothetical protein Q7U06_01145 [Pseudomonadota bacterium]|nr:hypothetical protein [Pseudomonadota bacterium]